MSGEPFIDTNVWVYAHLETPDDPKGRRARDLVESEHRFVLSTQVLNEYYAAMLKNRATNEWIQNSVERMIRCCEVRMISLSVIRQAYHVKNRYGFSIWDCLVISSALDAGCPLLYSEDLQHGQRIDGNLLVVNPFLEDSVRRS